MTPSRRSDLAVAKRMSLISLLIVSLLANIGHARHPVFNDASAAHDLQSPIFDSNDETVSAFAADDILPIHSIAINTEVNLGLPAESAEITFVVKATRDSKSASGTAVLAQREQAIEILQSLSKDVVILKELSESWGEDYYYGAWPQLGDAYYPDERREWRGRYPIRDDEDEVEESDSSPAAAAAAAGGMSRMTTTTTPTAVRAHADIVVRVTPASQARDIINGLRSRADITPKRILWIVSAETARRAAPALNKQAMQRIREEARRYEEELEGFRPGHIENYSAEEFTYGHGRPTSFDGTGSSREIEKFFKLYEGADGRPGPVGQVTISRWVECKVIAAR